MKSSTGNATWRTPYGVLTGDLGPAQCPSRRCRVRLRFSCLFLVPVALALTVVVQAASSPLAYEGFPLTFPQYNTGTGFSGAWQQGGFNVFASGYRASDVSLS